MVGASRRTPGADVILITDASAEGWACLSFFPATGTMLLLRQGWYGQGRWDLSTVAEPSAVARALDWLDTPSGRHHLLRYGQVTLKPRIALVTDHEPLVTGQSRWWSHNGGFSLNPVLNRALQRMHDRGVTAFHIPGALNPADGPSRTRADPALSVTMTKGQIVGPPLKTLSFPFGGKQRMMG